MTEWMVTGLMLLITTAPVRADGLFARGDADCNDRLSAADVVANVAALGGAPGCGNNDCDRDGAVTAADPLCSATCLFAECAIPPHAPRVDTAMADSAPAIVPFSAIQVSGANFGSDDRLKRVTIGGVDAEVVGFDDADTLVVVVPAGVPPGPAQIVVYDGDVPGPPSTVTVAAATPIGLPDTLDGTLKLVDTTVSLMLALDLESIFGAEAATLRQGLQKSRSDLAAQRAALAADPNLTSAVRAQLDAAFDSSGTPEMLRSVIADLEELLAPAAQLRFRPSVDAASAILAFQRGAKTVRIVGAVVATAATAPATLSATTIAGIALGLGIAAGFIYHFAMGTPTVPAIVNFEFQDVHQQPTERPLLSGNVKVTAENANPSSTALIIQEARGSQTVMPSSVVDGPFGKNFLFPLPSPGGDGDSFCGDVQFALVDTSTSLGTTSPLRSKVQPELIGTDPQAEGFLGQRVVLLARAVAGCLGDATGVFQVSPGETRFAAPLQPDLPTNVIIPDLNPHDFVLHVNVAGAESKEFQLFTVHDLLAPTITCDGSKLALPPSDDSKPPTDPTRVNCRAFPQPSNARFPATAEVIFTSTDPGVAFFTGQPGTPTSFPAILEGFHTGTVMVGATYVHRQTRLQSEQMLTVTVADESPPVLTVTSSPSAGKVDPGSAITVTVQAHDNLALREIDATASGDAIDGDTKQTFTCGLSDPDCSADFTFNLKSTGFTNSTVTITVATTDRSDFTTTADPLSFSLQKDLRCPVVTIQSPADGATVNAGDTVQVSALVTDNAQDDTGVKEVKIDVTGDALVGAVHSDVTLPKALPSATRIVPFTVKQAADLAGVLDKTIIISVEGIDAAQNTCLAQTISVTAAGMLETCSGAISSDNLSDCDGQPFTITVVLTGDAAANVARVTSVNPGGEFDLDPQGNGVYTVTLFYEGEGGFTLTFTAFDASGKGLCSNSIDLEATGPCDTGGAAQTRSLITAIAGAVKERK